MNGEKRRAFSGKWVCLVIAVCFAAALPRGAFAASTASVLEQHVTEDMVYLYVKHTGENQSAEARIGTEPVSGVTLTPGAQTPIVTWLLLDNSASISTEDQAKAKELFTDLVAGKATNEKFVLGTYDKQLNILAQDSDRYVDLKSQIDGIQRNDQESYLTDVLEEVLDIESAREELAFVRIVLVCDGVDQNPEGFTREELDTRLAKQNIPIYTFGCERGDNEPLLKALYALSRQTGARNWSLTGMDDTLEVAGVLSEEEIPICAEIPIPERLRDGSGKGIQLTFDDGASVQTQAVMPFGTALEETTAPTTALPQQTALPEPTSQPSVSEPPGPIEAGPGFPVFWIVIFAVAAAVIAIAVIAVLLMRRKREKERIRPARDVNEPVDPPTDILNSSSDGGTEILVHQDSRLTLILSDLTNPEHRFEVPLCGHVTIGRAAGNTVVVDYDRSVSNSHCEIFMEKSEFKLRDTGSLNGTYIDGVRVVDVAEISNGSNIRIGRLNFLVEIR